MIKRHPAVFFGFKAACLTGACAVFCLAGASPAAAQAITRSICDPEFVALDRADAFRIKGDFKEARKRIQPVLDKRPADFRATYMLATILLAGPDAGTRDKGLSELLQAEKLLATTPRGCAAKYGWYSIYNTLAKQYFDRNDLAVSERYLLLGNQHIKEVYPETQQLLLTNLGLLYFEKGDLARSTAYYTDAIKAGSTTAPKYLAAVQSVQEASVSQAAAQAASPSVKNSYIDPKRSIQQAMKQAVKK